MKSNFKTKVYKICSYIPKGKVATYGQLAKLAGKSKAARAVGVFMKNNPDAPIVPCHRVVASDGKLIGYSGVGGIAQKKKMLIDEGVSFKNNKVDLSRSQWIK
ncbi:MAG: 6-O-methylguanine-DNA methyltransferase-like protein [Candidatus Roizmanbacteria bacterium GW2011_GWC2_34_23]|uniref:methylated-DNA--[protein]-cysteine S-methyltransferase n=1 Tax=Candidatus Roizmanbacteria bacterium GW2011_GWC2_34_23 TaxID=1618484 RepID=A0A0G0AYD8_9BACT|nr:MAG: 6-O-methylguanine-DNA methyltransferase-like protein [Candidatus Roizmanbacteria bacterium GW2011_GWC2_34_23]